MYIEKKKRDALERKKIILVLGGIQYIQTKPKINYHVTHLLMINSLFRFPRPKARNREGSNAITIHHNLLSYLLFN